MDNKIRTKFTEMSKIFKDVIDEYESLKNENLKLREEIELQKDYIDALPHRIEELTDELNIISSENHLLNNQVEKHKEAYSLMCSQKTKKYNELMVEKNKLEKKELYNVLDAKNSSKI